MHVALASKVRELKRRSLIGQLVVVFIGMQLFFFGAFISIPLPIATEGNLLNYGHSRWQSLVSALPYRFQQQVVDKFPEVSSEAGEVSFSNYVLQTPLAVFVGYTLGSLLGAMAALGFFLLGLFGPLMGIYPFAAGGGLNYCQQPGFGYLLGMVAASWCVGRLTLKRRTSFRQMLAVVTGLAAVHLTGLIYLLGCCLLSQALTGSHSPLIWQQWLPEEIRNLTLYPLPYDFIFSVALVGLGFPFRWLVNILTAPDIAIKPQRRLEEIV